jgi:cyclohexanone monooxygenase
MTRELELDYDAIVVGAGFGGLYMLRKLRDELGLKVRVLDKAGGVGGTWYWNRYPGARSDSESFVYSYSFDKDLLQDWEWSERYLKQPEILSYFEHVTDRFDLRRDIQLNTAVTAAHFDEANNVWTVSTDRGDRYVCRYLVTAVGLLSAINVPNFKGRETFKGEQHHTGAWPEGVTLAGKRVGVIGNGSTGVQFITATAPQAKHLTVFQRSPQYSVPAQHGPLTREFIQETKANYEQIWKDVRSSVVAFGFKESVVSAMSLSEDERRAVFQKAWDYGGGFHFMFGTFCDIATDRQANDAAAEFIRGKIANIVKDPETARMLTPRDLYAKRPLCDGGYYDTFNRDNVSLVDLKETPIVEMTPTGVKTTDGHEHVLDMLVFATGFDAVDGNYKRIDIRGRNGLTMRDKWKEGPTSYLGIATAEFPNLFMILGPNGPFTNLPPSIETQVELVAELIKHVRDEELNVIEATSSAERGWTATCNEIADMTLFPQAESWIFGANIPGKAKTVMFYMAGIGAYRQQLADVKQKGWLGFQLGRPTSQVPLRSKEAT